MHVVFEASAPSYKLKFNYGAIFFKNIFLCVQLLPHMNVVFDFSPAAINIEQAEITKWKM